MVLSYVFVVVIALVGFCGAVGWLRFSCLRERERLNIMGKCEIINYYSKEGKYFSHSLPT